MGSKRNYLLAVEVDERIETERKAHKCSERMIDGEVSVYCVGCHHYATVDQMCTVRDDVIQGLNEDREYQRLGI